MLQMEVIRKIIELLKNEMELFNFSVNLKQQGFIRRDKSAIYFYYFLIYNRTNIKAGAKGFLIEPYAEINIPDIEAYYKEITENRELKTEWNFVTLGNSIASLAANPDGINRKRSQSLDLFVFDENDITVVTDKLLTQFSKVALPYFIANNSVAKVDELLNKHPEEYCVHLYNDIFRFIKGLIAAKLNGNTSIDRLIQIYDNLLINRNMPDYCKKEMSRLKSVLPMIGTRHSL